MQKFTIFTAILAVTSLVVFAELSSTTNNSDNFLSSNLPDTEVANDTQVIQTNVLGSNLNLDQINTVLDSETYSSFSVGASVPSNLVPTDNGRKRQNLISTNTSQNNTVSTTPSRLSNIDTTNSLDKDPIFNFEKNIPSSIPVDFEDEGFTPYKTVDITDKHISTAGFKDGFVSEAQHNGLLYKSITFSDLPNVFVKKSTIQSTDEVFAMVYAFTISQPTTSLSVYNMLKSRLKQLGGGLDKNINESNTFGDNSFYFNDVKRPNVAFLTIKIKNSIYCFSYPKENHPQIINLISLLQLEF